MSAAWARFGNPVVVPFQELPLLDGDRFAEDVCGVLDDGGAVASFFGMAEEGALRLIAALRLPRGEGIGLLSTRVSGAFTSLTPRQPALHLFEREIAEQFGVTPSGHPWPKPVRFAGRLDGGPSSTSPVGVTDYYRVDGEEVHEVAVGPVHAGIIEPGHFRFQCHGESVFHLEISLGYQHRGIERELLGGPNRRTLRQMETIAGDTTIGHGSAYCMVREVMAGIEATPRAEALRAVALELERLANHTGDLGALAGDVGYLPSMSYCGRIRGDFLNLTAQLCGSRFGRGFLLPGGIAFDLEPQEVDEILRRLSAARSDLTGAVELLWNTPSVINRFDQCGIVASRTARELGLVGPAARASGIGTDIRRDLPWGHYRHNRMPLVVMQSGDVYARAQVRWQECRHSLDFIEETLMNLPPAERPSRMPAALPAGMVAVALTEGWRGEICHVAVTGDDGRFLRYKVKDPSFHNWSALAMALRNNEISDFPLNNKSFNLSYCGFDL